MTWTKTKLSQIMNLGAIIDVFARGGLNGGKSVDILGRRRPPKNKAINRTGRIRDPHYVHKKANVIRR